jgi:soluble lytic murein transglycosylase-like protein
MAPDVQHTERCKHRHLAEEIAPIVLQESERFEIHPLLVAAAIKRESGFNIQARGKAGEIGLMQIKRGGATQGFDKLTDKELERPEVNIYLGVRYMYWMQRRCGGDPSRWLGAYSGCRCGPSRYAKKVLEVFNQVLPYVPRLVADGQKEITAFMVTVGPSVSGYLP